MTQSPCGVKNHAYRVKYNYTNMLVVVTKKNVFFSSVFAIEVVKPFSICFLKTLIAKCFIFRRNCLFPNKKASV
jgi:hypothetical protein